MPFTKLLPTSIDLAQNFTFTGTVAGAGGGKIGQVVQSETDYYHNLGATTSNVTLKFNSSTNWNPSITPTATSSKILIIVNFMLFADAQDSNNNGRARIKFYETVGGTETQFLDDYEANGIYDHGGHGNWFNHPYNRSFLRSPNTTGAVLHRGSTIDLNQLDAIYGKRYLNASEKLNL